MKELVDISLAAEILATSEMNIYATAQNYKTSDGALPEWYIKNRSTALVDLNWFKEQRLYRDNLILKAHNLYFELEALGYNDKAIRLLAELVAKDLDIEFSGWQRLLKVSLWQYVGEIDREGIIPKVPRGVEAFVVVAEELLKRNKLAEESLE